MNRIILIGNGFDLAHGLPTSYGNYPNFGYKYGDYPKAEAYYQNCISLPLYLGLTDDDLKEIVKRVSGILRT